MNKIYDAACFGEILWDLLPSGAKPGGAPMNVAYHLQKLGLQAAMISRIGSDERGDALLQVLDSNGVTTEFVQQDKAQVTGVVNATLHESNEVTYDIVQPVAWDFIDLQENLPDLVRQARYFIYGSLAARSQPSAQTLWQLVEVAQTKVVDINLRPPHFTTALVERLLQSADILKLNEHELPLISGWFSQHTATEAQVMFLQDHFSIPTIIVTKGGDGAMVCHEGALYSHPGYRVKVADTVGSGDAFLAGFLAKTSEKWPIEKRLQFANSLGAFIASKQGACPPYNSREIASVIGDLPVQE